MKDRKKRNLAIGMLCCMLVFMGVGFAILNTTLNIEGTATAINTWSIVIDSITPIDNETAATSVSTEIQPNKSEASFAVDFTKPGDYLEYEVVVSNKGSIVAYLEEVKLEFDDSTNPDNSLFKITNNAEKGTAINAGESISFKVRIEYDSEADRMPSSSVKFNLYTNVVQKMEQNVETPDEEDWTFKVDNSGTIVAYNYEKGTDVVVPAEVDGIPVTTITASSFLSNGNVELYFNDDPIGMYGIIYEEEPNFTYAKDKLVAMFTSECEGDATCIEQYKSMMYVCKDSNTCYNVLNMEQHALDLTIELTLTSIPNTAKSAARGEINPDPNVPLEESMVESTRNISSLDLSMATNLKTIEDSAFNNAGLTSVNFSDNTSITSIGDNAFYNNQISGKVIIPDSVTMIGDYAFESNQISSLTLGDSITSVGDNAFSNNQISGKVIIPDGLSKIGNYAFKSNQITEIYLSKTVTSLGWSVFYNNSLEILTIEKCNVNICAGGNFDTQTKSLIIESGELGEFAFPGNHSPRLIIENLTLGNGVTSIGDSAFYNNQISGELIIPDSVTTIGDSAFYNNQISGELTIPDSVTTIGAYIFAYNQISNLTLGKSVTTIGANAFYKNQISGELTIPDNVTTIGDNAFFNNQISGELTIPDNVTTIGDNAFEYNEITSLTLPNSVITIGNWAFYAQRDINKNSTLSSILIKRTKEDFLANVTVADYWYDDSLKPTITYDPS